MPMSGITFFSKSGEGASLSFDDIVILKQIVEEHVAKSEHRDSRQTVTISCSGFIQPDLRASVIAQLEGAGYRCLITEGVRQ